MEPQRVLIVDCDARMVGTLCGIAERAGYSVGCHTAFESARRELTSHPPALVIANVRLAEFNGIHLAYLARSVNPNVRILIYARPHDPILAREAQAAGAFYERGGLTPFSLPALLRAALPKMDRREPTTIDRRIPFRGGRRTTDAALRLSPAF